MRFSIPLRIVFYKEAADWVAHCLEFDLLGDGQTKEVALDCLVEAIVLQLESSVEHGDPGILFSPAPGEYLQKFAAGKDAVVGNLQVVLDTLSSRLRPPYAIEEPQLREYSDSGEDSFAIA